MVEQTTVMGMVISSMPISEYDKRLVILTKEFGKITAFARGARKATSAFLAGSQSMAFGEFTLYRGRNSYTVTGIKINDYFSDNMADLTKMYMSMYFLELADYYGREGMEASDTLKLLYLSMKTLGKNSIPERLVRCIFELKILVINGEYPNFFTCGNCNSKDNLDYFDESHNTMICSNCHGTMKNIEIIKSSTLYALQFIVSSPIEKLFTFSVKEDILEQMEHVISGYINKHIDKKFNSLEFL